MKKATFIDNTKQGCWGYNPEPENHDAFVGWRTILDRSGKKPRLDYVPGRCSAKGLKTDVDRLVRWWSKRVKWWMREVPEKWWLENCSHMKNEGSFICGPSKFGYLSALVKRSDDYVYISLYLDHSKNEEVKNEN